MDAERMPGDAEAAAAAAGMAETYGERVVVVIGNRRISKGDLIRYRRLSWAPGTTDEGRVIAFHRGRILLETETDVVEVEAEELLPF